LEKESKLLRSHSPVNDPENNEQRQDKKNIIKDEIGKCTCLQGRDIHDKKNRGKIDLTGAGKFEKGDDEARRNGGSKIPAGLAPFPDGPVDSFLQKFGKLKLHFGGTTSFQLDHVIEAQGPQGKGKQDRHEIDYPGEERQEREVLDETKKAEAD
jgi:hypothetical protein